MLKHKRLSLFVVLAMLVMAVVPAFAQDSGKVEMWIAFTDSRLDWAKQKAADFHAQFPDLPEIDVVGIPDYETLFTNAATAAEQNALPAILQYFEVASQNGSTVATSSRLRTRLVTRPTCMAFRSASTTSSARWLPTTASTASSIRCPGTFHQPSCSRM